MPCFPPFRTTAMQCVDEPAASRHLLLQPDHIDSGAPDHPAAAAAARFSLKKKICLSHVQLGHMLTFPITSRGDKTEKKKIATFFFFFFFFYLLTPSSSSSLSPQAFFAQHFISRWAGLTFFKVIRQTISMRALRTSMARPPVRLIYPIFILYMRTVGVEGSHNQG